MDQEKRLDSWKEIQNYLNRDVRTLRRWEKEEGLPVHRHSHRSRSSVYAYPSEIDAWRLSRKLAPEPAPPMPLWRRLWRPSFAVALVACLFMAGSGIRPVSARQSDGKMAARQVWVQTARESVLDISRDGRYAALVDWTSGDLGVHDFKTGANRRLTDTKGLAEADSAAASPDGRWIAYSWDQFKDPYFEAVMLIPAAGGAPKTLWRGTGDEGMVPVGWAPDGNQILVKHILAGGETDLAMMRVRDASVHKIKSFAKGVSFLTASVSPDGRWIAYAAPNQAARGRTVFVLSADGSRETKVVGGGAQPVWSPDGLRIVFSSGRTGKPTLWSIPIADGKPGKEELIRDDIGSPTWMTRSGTLFYQSPAPGGWDIYSAELGADGKVSQPPVRAVPSFLDGNNAPALSPDGLSLFYRSSARKGSIVRTLATGEERVIAPSSDPKTCCGEVQWFPNGRSLLGSSGFPRGTGQHFYRTDVSTGKAELLFDSPKNFHSFALSSDGKSVFFGRDASLVRYDVDTKREIDLKNTNSKASIRGIAPSPDGKQVAYVVWDEDSSTLEVMPAGGGESRVLLPPLPSRDGKSYTAAAWTTDQRYLLVTQRSGDPAPVVVLRVPVAGGPSEPTGISMRGINGVQVHPDGRRIFFEANDSGPSEIWELENFLPKPGGR